MPTHSSGRAGYDDVDQIPVPLIDYFRRTLHTGRGTGHQLAMTDTFVPAFAAHPAIASLVEADRIAFFAGAKSGSRHRNIDLAFGPPGPGAVFDTNLGMLYGMPSNIKASGEYKSIMTAHGKAQGNRRDDFLQHAAATRDNHTSKAISFAICPVNAADRYYSYTAKKWWDHGDGKLRAARAVETLKEVPRRSEPSERGLDAMWTPVLVANNDPDEATRVAHWLREYPQPADGMELSWSWFVERMATIYVDRFA